MATGAAHGSAPSTASGREQHAYRQQIDRQLNRTRWQVKLIELGASSVLLLVGVLGFFLVASLVDHWVVSLGYFGRALLLAGLLVSAAYYVWRKILPLLVRSINPEYAAHAIEESTPTLKNSLLNFLLLRRSPSGVKEVVLEALEKRAAADISVVAVDAAVDRSKLIRMGYLLVGVMAFLGLYKILSPKDPFQTAARVLAPWADIARPSRVQISDVQPGSADVYLGESVLVSAAVAGAGEGDPLSVIFSTADGTIINQSVPMTAAAGGRFEATLPAGGTAGRMSSTSGLQQNGTYRIEAGDAVSPDFHLNVMAAPRIVVEKVEYRSPAYTRKAPQTTDRGDLKGLEGTRIAITARANQPIKSAWIELDPQPNGGPAETMKLDVEGDRATGVMVLQLRPDRRTTWRSAYQVRFINERQQQSQQPILHGIEVLRDLPPEVEIVAPQAREIEVPENGSQAIEVRAVDPDFGLTEVDLMGRARNKELVMQSLLEPIDGQPPQLQRRFDFRPSKWNLKAGEVLTYWATAEDNRTAVPSVASVQGAAMPTADPEPNVAKTEPYTIRIVAAREGGQQGGSGEGGDSADNPPMGDEGQQGENGAQQDSPMNGGNQGEQNKGENQSSSDKNDSNSSKSDQGEQGDSKSEKGSQSSGGSEQSSGSESGDGEQSKSQQGGGSSSSGESGSSGSQDSGGGSEGSESGAGSGNQGGGKQGKPSRDQGGDASSQGEPGDGGSSGTSKGGSRNQASAGEPGEPTGEPGGEPGSQGGRRGGAGSKKPEHDGEVFDRLLEEMKDEQGAQAEEGGGGKQNGAGQSGGPKSDQQNSSPMTGDQPGEGQQDQGNGAQQPKAGSGASRDGNNTGRGQGEPNEGDPASENGAQPTGNDSGKGGNAQGGKQGPQGAKGAPKNQPQPDGTDGSPMDGNAEKSDGPQGDSKKPMSGDDAQGKGPNDQKAPGEGGRPQGAARTDEGDPKTDKEGTGEPKEAGAGQNGDSGAGQNSTDKTGSGQGQETNRDRKKDMSDSNSAPKNGETSAPSGSKRQSDSKGGTSGDRSGGGSKGAGQSGGQEGNDTAGSNSAADEGAGAANETGMGETGSKGGQGEKSEGQTGSAGDEKGEGSSSRPSEAGSEKGPSPQNKKGDRGQKSPMNKGGEKGPQSGEGDPASEKSEANDAASSSGQKTAGGAGPVVGGGQQGDRPQVDYGPEGPATEADEANLEFAKKATDLVLSKLKEQEHNPDPELLDRLGMSREQMQEFVRRWEGLKNEAGRDPKAARELNEALRSLGLKDPKQRKRTGGSVSDDQRNLRDSGTRIPPPSKYRDQFDAFRKGAARSGNR